MELGISGSVRLSFGIGLSSQARPATVAEGHKLASILLNRTTPRSVQPSASVTDAGRSAMAESVRAFIDNGELWTWQV